MTFEISFRKDSGKSNGEGDKSNGIPAGDRGKGPDNNGTLKGFRVGRTK